VSEVSPGHLKFLISAIIKKGFLLAPKATTYMVQSKRRLLYIREKSRSHKTKNPLFHLVPCHELLIIILNCSHIRYIIKYFLNNKIES
jgi:hypothetical protein